MSIEQFLKRNVSVLAASFEANEGDYDDAILPPAVVTAACRKLNKAMSGKKEVTLGRTSILDATKQIDAVIAYQQSEESGSTLERKRLSFSSFPKNWKRRRIDRQSNDDGETDGTDQHDEEDEVNEGDSDDAGDAADPNDRRQYEEKLQQVLQLEADIAAVKKKVKAYEEIVNVTRLIQVPDLEKSFLSEHSELTQELAKSSSLATDIAKRLARHPHLQERLRETVSQNAAADSDLDTTLHQAALKMLTKMKNKDANNQ